MYHNFKPSETVTPNRSPDTPGGLSSNSTIKSQPTGKTTVAYCENQTLISRLQKNTKIILWVSPEQEYYNNENYIKALVDYVNKNFDRNTCSMEIVIADYLQRFNYYKNNFEQESKETIQTVTATTISLGATWWEKFSYVFAFLTMPHTKSNWLFWITKPGYNNKKKAIVDLCSTKKTLNNFEKTAEQFIYSTFKFAAATNEASARDMLASTKSTRALTPLSKLYLVTRDKNCATIYYYQSGKIANVSTDTIPEIKQLINVATEKTHAQTEVKNGIIKKIFAEEIKIKMINGLEYLREEGAFLMLLPLCYKNNTKQIAIIYPKPPSFAMRSVITYVNAQNELPPIEWLHIRSQPLDTAALQSSNYNNYGSSRNIDTMLTHAPGISGAQPQNLTIEQLITLQTSVANLNSILATETANAYSCKQSTTTTNGIGAEAASRIGTELTRINLIYTSPPPSDSDSEPNSPTEASEEMCSNSSIDSANPPLPLPQNTESTAASIQPDMPTSLLSSSAFIIQGTNNQAPQPFTSSSSSTNSMR